MQGYKILEYVKETYTKNTMLADNNKIFDKIWKQALPYGLCFISSNGGTGKTTYFKFRFLRDAVERGYTFSYILPLRERNGAISAFFFRQQADIQQQTKQAA